MKNIIIISAILLSISCTSKSQEIKTSEVEQNTTKQKQFIENKKSNGLTINDALYTLNIYIETTAENVHYLVMNMELKDSSYFVSPLSKKGFSGLFKYDFGSYKDLAFFGEVIETPSAFKQMDVGLINKTVEDGLVNKNTVYKQALTIKTNSDFEVLGRIRFTIEPRCTYEELPFRITSESGAFKVSEAKC